MDRVGSLNLQILSNLLVGRMSIFGFNIYCSALLFLLVNSSQSLRCRSGNQRSNDQLHKIIQNCRKKYSGGGGKSGNDYTNSSENDSSDEDSSSSVNLDEDFFFANGNARSGGNNSRNSGNYGQSSNGNNGENRRNDRRKPDSYANRPYSSNSTNYTWMNDRGNGMSNQNENRYYRNGMQTQYRDNERRDKTECVTHCIFDELNVIDQRGFPDRSSIMEIMTREIQDPSLRDFIEESIIECFHYLDSDPNNREKCAFAKNLMSCIADKGREKCEDWDDR